MREVCITVSPHLPLDTRSKNLIAAAPSAGIEGLRGARVSDLYFVRGELSDADINRLCADILADPAAHDVAWAEPVTSVPAVESSSGQIIEVAYLPGVMDPLALQLQRAAQEIGLSPIEAATGTRYELDAPADCLQLLIERLLYNATVQRFAIGRIDPQFAESASGGEGRVESVALDGLDDAALVSLSKTRLLSLSVDEMRTIQAHFASQGRAPTDVELEMLAQTWSEHCCHKTFKAIIEYTDADGKTEIIDGLLKSTIRKATEEINAPWVRSAFVDNAGVIAFDDNWDLSFKVETHNHPSALEPFGGANTGVGGVIRDIMGVSARPIAVTDVLCFGPQDLPFEQLPSGALHPRRVQEGVVSGIQDYGNKFGLPTVAGAVYYDPGYTANPLVFAGCVGIAPKGSHPTGTLPGDRVIVLGGRTGRDGLHGATFSSDALAHDTGQVAGTAVQIGNPIVQKDVMELLLRARDAKLYHAITDCGAGGLSSAVGEMAQQSGGVEVELAQVPLKYPGLLPWEIWLSEAQERMVIAIPASNWPAIQALCEDWDVEATDIGTFTESGKVVVNYADKTVADLDLIFLHDGLPRLNLKAVSGKAKSSDYQKLLYQYALEPGDYNAHLLRLLSHPNIASKQAIIHRYDHEVRAGTVVKPLAGKGGPSDATVIKPIETPGHNRGFALGIGVATCTTDNTAFDPVCEAINNVIAVGADPNQIAILDNFCWGDPKSPEQLGLLVKTAKKAAESAIWHKAPFISGKDSLNNTYIDRDGSRTNIPGMLVVSAIGILPDVTKAITIDFKTPGNRVYALASTTNLNAEGVISLPEYDQLFRLIQEGIIVACHDAYEGGFVLAAAEMCVASQLGLAITEHPFKNLGWIKESDRTIGWFGVITDCLIVEAKTEISDDEFIYIGRVTAEPRLVINPPGDKTPIIDLPVSELTAAFKREGKYAQ
ncbi:MAG TPA: AIR synthase-related protein [Aggregatilineales bacterium]|nr:AIR synthase-related protein [Aggregatilineales bacterium]